MQRSSSFGLLLNLLFYFNPLVAFLVMDSRRDHTSMIKIVVSRLILVLFRLRERLDSVIDLDISFYRSEVSK